jgi:phage/plasmid primase-like uncharacterized protein
LSEIKERRPLGDARNNIKARAKVEKFIIDNMARNLAKQEVKQLAVDFEQMVEGLKRGTVMAKEAIWDRRWQPRRRPKNVKERADALTVVGAVEAVKEQQKAVQEVVSKVSPRTRPTPPPKSEAEIVAEFAEACQRMGLKLEGPPIMDGKGRNVPLEGGPPGKKSGFYVGHLDGTPSGYIRNHRSGEELRWRASVPMQPMTKEQREARQRQIEADRAARAAERAAREERVAALAKEIWDNAAPAMVVKDGYLDRKGVQPHWLRQDRRGNLLVPLQDASGKIWNIQSIGPDGSKMFGVLVKEGDEWKRLGGRKQGLYAVLGGMQEGKPVALAEGFASAASFYETTGITSVIAFDAGNLLPVSKTIRASDADRQIIFAADNDHHLPRRDPPEKNVGLEKAHAASREVGGVVIAPRFEAHENGTDWNDALKSKSRRAVREELKERLAEVGVQIPEAERQDTTQRPRGPRL